MITADHGNAEQMYGPNKTPFTAHTCNRGKASPSLILLTSSDTKQTTRKLILLKIIRYCDESKVTGDTNIVTREFLTPYFMKTLCIVYSSFFKFCPTLHPTHPLAFKLHPTVLFVALFLWLNGWSHNILGVVLLIDITDLHM